ncbi:MAG: DUF5615 family PIN-like protein [Actinobacteria bacterium]|nr:DUF5615 family PIN-like protein [Actinomycetota bacterium]
MRLLLDEQVPRVFADLLPGHEVATAQTMGWAGVKNEELMRRAAAEGFDVLITIDKNIEFQQNLTSLPLSVVLVRARSNRIDDLEPLASAVQEAVEGIVPRTLVRVGV